MTNRITTENKKKKFSSSKHLLPIFITAGLNILLFIILYAFINPKISATEKLNDHETRISINETNIQATNKQLEKLNNNVEKILDILFNWKRGGQ